MYLHYNNNIIKYKVVKSNYWVNFGINMKYLIKENYYKNLEEEIYMVNYMNYFI